MDFNKFYNNILELKQNNIDMFSICKTYLNNDIFCINVGSGRPYLLVQYSIHAREYITTLLAMKQIKYMLKQKNIGTIFFIPCINPDGVMLVLDGLKNIKDKHLKDKLVLINSNSLDFSLWKANVRGVDLNVNFPANWGTGAKNIRHLASENYIGEFPCSEKETRSLVNFTNNIKPDCTISYHSKGEEIYYQFYQDKNRLERDFVLAKEIQKCTGYKIVSQGKSSGGYKDWCIQSLHIPSFTIEVGNEKLNHPIKSKNLPRIWKQNKLVLIKILALLK